MSDAVRLPREKWLSRLEQRLRTGFFVRRATEWVAGFCMVAGVAFLAIKLYAPQLWPVAIWALLLVIPVLVNAWWRSHADRFTGPQSVALLDKRIDAGGLLMAVAESPDSRWEPHLPAAKELWDKALPAWRPWRMARVSAGPVLFLLLTCWIAPRSLPNVTSNPTDVSGEEITRLTQLLEELKENQVLEKEEEETLREEINRLAEATRYQPLTHENWETVDALRQRMEMNLDERRAELARLAGSAAALERALASDGENESDETRSMRDRLQEMLEQANLVGGGGGGAQSNQANGEARQGNGDPRQPGEFRLPEDPEALAQALRELQDVIDAEMKKLAQAGMCSQCQGNGEPCAECQGNQGRDGDGLPGRGGVSRGRADAEMSWGEEADQQGVRFKEMLFPKGIPDPEGELIKIQMAAPNADPAAPGARAGGNAGEGGTGGEAWKQTLRPRHREAVRDYFGGQ